MGRVIRVVKRWATLFFFLRSGLQPLLVLLRGHALQPTSIRFAFIVSLLQQEATGNRHTCPSWDDHTFLLLFAQPANIFSRLKTPTQRREGKEIHFAPIFRRKANDDAQRRRGMDLLFAVVGAEEKKKGGQAWLYCLC